MIKCRWRHIVAVRHQTLSHAPHTMKPWRTGHLIQKRRMVIQCFKKKSGIMKRYFSYCSCLPSLQIQAQTKTVRVCKDSTRPVAGASVMKKDSVQWHRNGCRWKIQYRTQRQKQYHYHQSSLGFAGAGTECGTRSSVTVVLHSSVAKKDLEDVVVVGYTKQKR